MQAHTSHASTAKGVATPAAAPTKTEQQQVPKCVPPTGELILAANTDQRLLSSIKRFDYCCSGLNGSTLSVDIYITDQYIYRSVKPDGCLIV